MTTPSSAPSTNRPHRYRALPAIAATAAIALVAAACGDNSDDTTTAGSADGSGDGDMTISIESPADGDEVTVPFDVEVDTSVDIGEPDTGLHHVHLYYDGATADGEYDLVYDPSFTVDRDLGEGEHTVEAVLANADHSLTASRHEITVAVGDGTDSDSDGSDSSVDDPY